MDLATGIITIRQALVVPGTSSRPVLSQVKTQNSRRTLYLGRTAVAILCERKAQQVRDRAFMESDR